MKNTLENAFSMKVEGGGHYLRAVNDDAEAVCTNLCTFSHQ